MLTKCHNCRHFFVSFTAKEKCRKSAIKLGHATVYENCSTARSREGGCGPKGRWFEPIEPSAIKKDKTILKKESPLT